MQTNLPTRAGWRAIEPVDVGEALAAYGDLIDDDRLWHSAISAAASALEYAANGVDVIAAPVVMPARVGAHDDAPHDAYADLLGMVADGLSDESIARRLGCSVRTVGRRIAEAKARYGVRSRYQLAAVVS